MQKIDINECVIQCVDTVEYQLSQFNVEFADGVDNDLANLFMSALKKGEVTPGEKADEYAKIISMKIEAGLVLKYGSDVDLLTHEFVCDFCKELLGEELGRELIIEKREPEIVKISSIIGRIEIPRIENYDEEDSFDLINYAVLIPEEKDNFLRLRSLFRTEEVAKGIAPIDYFVAYGLIDFIVNLCDKYINSVDEDKINAIFEFFMQKTCATLKLNEILQDDLCEVVDLDEFIKKFDEDDYIINYKNEFMEYMDCFIEEMRKVCKAIRGEDS